MNRRTYLLRLCFVLTILAVVAVTLAPRGESQAQDFGVTITAMRETVFVRIAPAIGHEVIGSLVFGQSMPATGRSPNGQWLRIVFNGAEGWVGSAVVSVSGNPAVLPVNDPITTPFNLGDGPRAGASSASGPAAVRLPESGIRLRAGPSRAYFVIDNVPRYEIMAATGRSPDGQWIQVNYRGTLGWIGNMYIEWWDGDLDALPLWGIVASAPPAERPQAGPSASREALLTAMLLHINVTANRLDVIEGVWRSIIYSGEYFCRFAEQNAHPQYYIPRPEDLAAYPELDPVIASLNQGLEELGHAIEEWQLLCELDAQGYPITREIVLSGLQAVFNARRGFDDARRQIFALGIQPTPVPPPPGFTPASPIATVTAPAPDLPPLMAFGLQDNRVTFTAQFTHPDLGCNWQGFGGQVFGMQGEPLIGFTIRVEGVTDPTFFYEVVSGDQTVYGPSGWEVQVAPGINTHVFRVTVYQNGRRVSDPRQIGFPADCTRNLGVLNFVQLTPLE